ncbi:MAG: phosphoribosylformylglycinamidine synthase subunit PurS [Candidatus Atribacteria bacterium]|nr:phosphoribosylformylglycinamidine synthase subunit PurS [Candidatus Atribacteria bacterium]
MKFLGKVIITLKSGVFDPQGLTIKNALHTLGYRETQDVKTGKYFEIMIEAENQEKAQSRLSEMCDQLLANPVIEQYTSVAEPVKS